MGKEKRFRKKTAQDDENGIKKKERGKTPVMLKLNQGTLVARGIESARLQCGIHDVSG